MQRMARLRDLRYQSTVVVFCIALGLSQGCIRSEPLKPTTAGASSGSKQKLPFHEDIQQASAKEKEVGADPAISPEPKLPGGLPFPAGTRARVLPPGTLLTVQLENSLSAINVHSGDNFAARVAAPLVVEGDTLIQSGTEVIGRVEAAQSRRGSGYVRLTLSEITVDGWPLALQTSSLFARGTPRHLASSVGNPSTPGLGGVRVPKGRRLTFRLTAPVTLNELNPPEKSRSLSTASE